MKSLAGLTLFALACNSTSSRNAPLPPVTTEAGVPPAAVPFRTVGHRNPLGDALQSDNLMVDGDFELTGRTDQAPWVVFNNNAQGVLNYDTGGRCRSGIRCAVIGTGDELIGWFSSPAADSPVIRLYVMPDTGHCADVTAIVVDITTGIEAGVVPAPKDAGADGWCEFLGTVSNMAYEQPAVVINLPTSSKAKTVHVDQGSVLPMSEVPIHGIKALTPVDADTHARVQQAAAWIRAHRKYGRNIGTSVPDQENVERSRP